MFLNLVEDATSHSYPGECLRGPGCSWEGSEWIILHTVIIYCIYYNMIHCNMFIINLLLDNKSFPNPCFTQMWKAMAKIRKLYLVAFQNIDSVHLAEPSLRRRVYIVLIRRPCKIMSANQLMTSNQFHSAWVLPTVDSNDPFWCGRDVALQKITTHDTLESHCKNMYKKIREELPDGITVPLAIVHIDYQIQNINMCLIGAGHLWFG